MSQSTIDTAWQEGIDAFNGGTSEEANPYPNPSIEHESWADGWEDGQEDQSQR